MARDTRHHYTEADSNENLQGSLRVHESGSVSTAQDFTYVGSAQEPGTQDAEECWRIFRVEETGSLTFLTHPSGSDSYSFRWDDRLDLPYV